MFTNNLLPLIACIFALFLENIVVSKPIDHGSVHCHATRPKQKEVMHANKWPINEVGRSVFRVRTVVTVATVAEAVARFGNKSVANLSKAIAQSPRMLQGVPLIFSSRLLKSSLA